MYYAERNKGKAQDSYAIVLYLYGRSRDRNVCNVVVVSIKVERSLTMVRGTSGVTSSPNE